MSIVTGIATASGISPLLNAPRDTIADLRAARGDGQQATVARLAEDHPRVSAKRKVVRPVLAPAKADTAQSVPARTPSNSGDNRYARFVQAVEALRLDYDAASELTAARIAELKAAAEEVFKMGDSVPREVRASDSRTDDPAAVDQARREKAAERAEAADRAEKARAAKAELAALEAREQRARIAEEKAVPMAADAPPPPELAVPEPVFKPAADAPEAPASAPEVAFEPVVAAPPAGGPATGRPDAAPPDAPSQPAEDVE